ncbi:hypothetical protein J6590_099892 [Homalodisca vitripennis]|nr:hypothetical protein J6590_099892 [Homalodisca vitripennis]
MMKEYKGSKKFTSSKYLLEFPTKKPWCMEWLEVLTQWTVLGRQSEWRRDRVDNYRQIYLKVLKKFEA